MGKNMIMAALAVLSTTSLASAAVVNVSGWVVHNGTSTVGGTPSNPTFTAADNITVLAPFDSFELLNDGDSIQGQTTLTVIDRTGGVGVNTLNTQLRVGLFHDTANDGVTANDVPNIGFIIEYTTLAAGGLIREQQSLIQQNPFTSPTNLGNGVQDAGADSIQGANPGPVTFDLKLTRNAGKIDLLGVISGTDSVSGNPYSSTYTLNGITPANDNFTFNRLGLFLGDGVNGTSATLADSTITTIPEPTALGLMGLIGGALMTRRSRR